MAKATKTENQTQTATTPAVKAPTVDTGVDISKLTPAQLSALQKQLKETKKATSGSKDARFAVIDTMLQEKDGTGFRHTTRDILNRLIGDKLVTCATKDDEQNEIKKIQARKQFLEKKTDKAGKLVSPAGTFGYKSSGGFGNVMNVERILAYLTPEVVKGLTKEQRAAIVAAVK